MIRRPPTSPLFPYPTLFLSRHRRLGADHDRDLGRGPERLRARHALAGRRSPLVAPAAPDGRSEEHTSELQSQSNLVCRLLLEKKKDRTTTTQVANYTATYTR